jgi:hypothetical protein
MVRCIDCGFLAGMEFGQAKDRHFEVSPADRAKGAFYFGPRNFPNSVPVCYRGAAELPEEIIAAVDEPWLTSRHQLPDLTLDQRQRDHRDKATVEVISRDRDCDKWTPYIQNRDPAQHYEELRMLQLAQQQRESEERIAKLNLQIANAVAKSSESSERIGEQSLEVARLSHAHNRKWTIIFAIFAIATFVAQAFYPDGIDVPRTIEWLRSLLPK